MAKASAGRSGAGGPLKARAGLTKVVKHETDSAGAVVSKARFEATMQAARLSGLLGEKAGRIGGRVSPALVKRARRQTGIQTDTDLIEFALATVALEDHFADAFKKSRGRIDPKLKLGF